MEKDLVITTCWSDEIAQKTRDDFLKVENEVFDGFLTDFLFNQKYINNIFGPSVLVVAYHNGIPVGADALWRNDVDGQIAYQSADTCVLGSYRGKGIFSKMVEAKVSFVQSDVLIYGFPNAQSFPGFVKLGWSVVKLYKAIALFVPPKGVAYIDDAYAKWWLRLQSGITYMKRRGRYYLVRKKTGKPFGIIIGRVERSTALLFPKKSDVIAMEFFSPKPSFYNKGENIPVIYAKRPNETVVPYWKIDAI